MGGKIIYHPFFIIFNFILIFEEIKTYIMNRIINLITIYWYYLQPKKVKNPKQVITMLLKLRDKLEPKSFLSNLTAGLIKKLRIESPYRVKDFTEAKKMYDDYFKMEGSIKSIDEVLELIKTQDVFITFFRNDFSEKGTRYCEYNMGSSFGHPIPTVYKIEKNDDYLELKSLIIGSYNHYFRSSFITMYRYSTQTEIERYRIAEGLIKHNNKKIEELNDEVRRLSNENNVHSKLKFQ